MAIGPNSVRTILYGINFIFVLTGIILAAHGMENVFFYRHYGDLIQDQYIYTSYFQIIVGLLICSIAIIGWYGALAESSIVTLLFSSFLLLVFFLELSIGIGGCFLNVTTRNSLSASLRLPNDLNDYTILYRWERLQTDVCRILSKYFELETNFYFKHCVITDAMFECCGIETPFDWFTRFNDSVIPILPDSCCYGKDTSWQIEQCILRDSYKTGCFMPLEAEIQDNCVMVTLLSFVIATMQLLGIILTCYLSGEFRKEYQSF